MPRTAPVPVPSSAPSLRAGRPAAAGADGPVGFTLIEILVVISIIALLAGLTANYVIQQREKAYIAAAIGEVHAFDLALDNYRSDEGDYPGRDAAADDVDNAFPALYRALCCAPRPDGPGGRSAPYAKPHAESLAVRDEETGGWRKAMPSELRRDDVDKYLLDPWGNPYVYRFPRDPETSPVGWVGPLPSPILFSCGRNATEDLARGEDDGDDIGNW